MSVTKDKDTFNTSISWLNNHHLNHLISSASATFIAELSTLPICTLKTRWQTGLFSRVLNIKDIYNKTTALGDILSKNGIKGLYRASYPAIGAQIISSAGKYTGYRSIQDYITRNKVRLTRSKFINNVGISISSGLLVSLITHPLDVCRVILQNQQSLISHLGRDKFYRLVYRGYSRTIMKQIVGSSLFFPIYDWAYIAFEDNKFKASIFSSVLSTTIIHPVDYLRTLRLAGDTRSIISILREDNLFRGLPLNLSRVVPHFTILILLTDYFKMYWRK